MFRQIEESLTYWSTLSYLSQF